MLAHSSERMATLLTNTRRVMLVCVCVCVCFHLFGMNTVALTLNGRTALSLVVTVPSRQMAVNQPAAAATHSSSLNIEMK